MPKTKEFALSVPFGEVHPNSNLPTELVMNLDPKCALTLAQIREGLNRDRCTLRDGAMVQSPKDAVHWIIEHLSQE
jgi:hypothetical protein